MEFNEKLILLRKQNGLSQEQLAEKIGVSRQAVSRWESGDTTPEMALFKKLCCEFGVTADYLLGDDEEAPGETPAVPKNEDVPPADGKKFNVLLIAAVIFTFSAVCFLIAAALATNEIQRILTCAAAIAQLCLAAFQFRRLKRRK